MTGKELKFQHLETDADMEQHLQLMRTVFGQNSRIDLLVKKWIDHHPAMTLKDFFIIQHHGKTVAALNVVPSTWSIGGIPLKVAELGCVATLPEYRHKGLQRMLMEEYHEQVSKQKYDLSAIEGIPYYYRQFGYEYAIPLQEETKIALNRIPDYHRKHTIRSFTSKDVPKAKQLLAKTQQKFYVHSIRNEEIWRMSQATGMVAEYEFEGYVVEEDGLMIAYFRTSCNPETKELFLREMTDVDQATAQSILSFLKDMGAQHGLENLVATTSYQEPFAKILLSLGASQSRPYAWQLRVMDYARLFLRLKQLFEKRLASSLYQGLTEKLNFNFYRYTIQMAVERGSITSVQRLENDEDRAMRFNPLAFTQLLFGDRNREELEAIYPDFIVKTSHKHLVDILFPKLPAYIHTEY